MIRNLFLCGALCASSSAWARDMSGRFGIGADSALGYVQISPDGTTFNNGLKVPGLSVVYRVSKLFGVQAIFSMNIDSGSIENPFGDDVKFTTLDLRLTAHGLLGLLQTDHVNLDLMFGTTIGRSQFSDNVEITENVSANDVLFDVGLRPEFFASPNLSFHPALGMSILVLDDGNGIGEGGVEVNILGAADLLGSAGFTFYF